MVLLILHWIAYWTGIYSLIYGSVGDILFGYIWIILSVTGFIVAIIEFTNNRLFSICLGGVAVLSGLFGMLTSWVGSM